MPIAAPIQTSLNAGEFSPLAYGRPDYPKYKNGVTLMQGFMPLVQGGAMRRTGTKFTVPTKNNTEARLIPFVFSNGDAFMLEFGDLYVRFYRNRAQVDASTAAAYNGATVYVKDDYVTEGGISYRSLQDANTGHTPSTSPLWWQAQVIYEITSPYPLADVKFLRVQQSKDVIYIAHPSHKPRKLARSALTAWKFTVVEFTDGPYLDLNSTPTTLAPSATTGTGVTITASSTVNINSGAGFKATDVGRFIRIKHSTGLGVFWGWAVITGFTSTTSVTVTVKAGFGEASASAVWRLGEWSDTTGYPSVVFSFEDRQGWAASPIAPITMNLSKTGDYDNFSPTDFVAVVAPDNALQLRLNSKQQDPIRWVYDDEKGLVAGTKSAEWLARASSTGDAMSALNYPSVRRSTKYGSANVEPIEVGKAILFAQTAKRKIRELAYVYEVDGFRAPDMTVLAEHATKTGVAQMCYQQEPFSIAWSRREDGQLWGMTYDREQDVVGWHRHPLGGFYDAGKTQTPHVESLATIPAPDGSQDDLWMIVNRYIAGGVKRYVEILTPFNSDYDTPTDCYFVDCGLTLLNVTGTTLTGLGHLEGETLDILVNGVPRPAKQVVSGSITLDRAATNATVHVGFGYKSRIKTLRPEGGSATGTSQAKTKRTHKLAARLHQTQGLRVGRSFNESNLNNDEGFMEDQVFRKSTDPMDVAVPLFSGDKILSFEDDYNTDGYICFEQRLPLPCTILAIMPQFHTQDAQ